jgi:hypothetical protein
MDWMHCKRKRNNQLIEAYSNATIEEVEAFAKQLADEFGYSDLLLF